MQKHCFLVLKLKKLQFLDCLYKIKIMIGMHVHVFTVQDWKSDPIKSSTLVVIVVTIHILGLEIKTCVRMDKPQNMKLGSNMFIKATTIWRKWKKRYLVLVQVGLRVWNTSNFKRSYFLDWAPTIGSLLVLQSDTLSYCEVELPAGLSVCLCAVLLHP